jgi:LAGLIDADG endonuclease
MRLGTMEYNRLCDNSEPRNRRSNRPHERTRETDRAWLAGIIDGEGSIHISRVTEPKNKSGFAFHPVLSITNTNESILSNIKRITDCGSICRVRSLRASWKDKYLYTANSNCVRKILPEVLPYLVAKREQARLLLKFVSLVKPAQKAKLQPRTEKQSLYSRMRILNRKGKRQE